MSFLNFYLLLRIIGSIVAGAGQVALPRVAAESSKWGLNLGWQREVGLWNFALAFLIVLVLWRGNVSSKVDLTWALIFLSVILGANHALELFGGGRMTLHLSAAIVNLGAVVLGVVALAISR